jgi:cell division protein FtsQ
MNVPKTKKVNKSRRPNRYRSYGRRNPGGGLLSGLWRTFKFVLSGVLALCLFGGLSAGLIVGGYLALNSEYFLVRKVVIKGIHRVSQEEIRAAVGLEQSSNILTLPLKEMGRRLEGLPWVQSVTLDRKLPNTLVIDVVERRPKTLINLGELKYLDKTGQPFKTVDLKEKPALPIVTGFTPEDFRNRPEFTRRDLEEVFGLLDVLATRNDRFRLENISEIHFDSARGLTLFTRQENTQVKIGFGDYAVKMRRLGRVMAHLKIHGQADQIVYINLENSPRVVVRRV